MHRRRIFSSMPITRIASRLSAPAGRARKRKKQRSTGGLRGLMAGDRVGSFAARRKRPAFSVARVLRFPRGGQTVRLHAHDRHHRECACRHRRVPHRPAPPRPRIKESFKSVVYVGAGITSLIIGIQMAMSASQDRLPGAVAHHRRDSRHVVADRGRDPLPRRCAEAHIRPQGRRQGFRLRVPQRLGALLRRGHGARRVVQGRGGRQLRPDLHEVGDGRVHVHRVHRGHGNRRRLLSPLRARLPGPAHPRCRLAEAAGERRSC